MRRIDVSFEVFDGNVISLLLMFSVFSELVQILLTCDVATVALNRVAVL